MLKTQDAPINPELDLVLEKILPLPKEKVWKAWTTPEILMQWFCPKPWTTTEAKINLYPGGHFFTNMQSPEGESYPNVGCFLEVVENQRLVWTDALLEGYRPAEQSFMTAILIFEDHPQGTKYKVIARHKNGEDRTKHEAMGFLQGWSVCADQLVEVMKNK